MLFAATRMDLEIVLLSEVSQRQVLYDIAYMWDLKKMMEMNLFTKKKETLRHRKQTMLTKRERRGR